MKQIILSLSIFASFIIFSNPLKSEATSVSISSRLNISQTMDVALRSNSTNYLFAQDTIASDTINHKTPESTKVKLKSPTKALVIALVPGAVIHGAGHFYAGKTKTAIGLFGAEIIGAGLTFGGLLANSLEGVEGSTSHGHGDVVLIFGLGLFIGSWMYDLIGSPFAVKDQNDKILGKKPFPYDLDLQFEKDNQQVKCLLVKHF